MNKNNDRSLATMRPDLAKEWHPTKNGSLRPEDVTYGSGKKVWWYLPYDDPKTGKHFDFEWMSSLNQRTSRNNDCPYLSGRAVWVGYNDLATTYPYIAKEWHPTKNGSLRPEDVTYGSSKKVWWYLPYDDPKTGKHFDFEWEAVIYSRVKGNGCPFLSGCEKWDGFNDLATTHPDLAKEWHPSKNGDLKPTDVTAGSNKKVWWFLPYDDPKTGKHFDFEWKTSVSGRTLKNLGCPYLSNHKLFRGFNDLATIHPDIAKEWHPIKNGTLTPADVMVGSNIKVWWFLSYNDSKTGKHFNFEWKTTVASRTNGIGCPYLSNPCKAILIGFNDLTTTHPDLAKEWHPTKNGNLKPTDVSAGSNRKVWWHLPFDDPKTGKHFDFEWEAVVSSRASGFGCPFLYGREAWSGFNDLETLYPQIAKEWHPTKNKNIKPSNVTSKSDKKVWWYLPYDDPVTGKHFDFEWEARIHNRTSGEGCPFLVGKQIHIGFNDLLTLRPDLVKQWHPTKNGNLLPIDVTTGSSKKIWWQCEKGHEWKSTIANRVKGSGCPTCAKEFSTSFPEQAIYYYVKKCFTDAVNTDRETLDGKEIDVFIPSIKTAIEYDSKTYHQDTIKDINKNKIAFQKDIRMIRIREHGCPVLEDNCAEYIVCEGNGIKSLENAIVVLLSKLQIVSYDVNINRDYILILNQITLNKKEKSLKEIFPDIAKEWHPTKNGNLKPTGVSAGSHRKVWWCLSYDDPATGKHFDFEWEAKVSSRTNGTGCPYLSGHKIWEGYNDLASTHPELCKEWHPSKNGSLKPTDVTSGSDKKIWWYLPYDDPVTGKHFDFEWEAKVSSRTNGNGCPYLSNQKVWIGYNDLETTNPNLVKEWHPFKNGDLKPTDVTCGSGKKVWWLNDKGKEWNSTVSFMVKSYCENSNI